jgi:hypothetical protein
MRRREFITVLGATAFGWPIASRAEQHNAQMPVIGLLTAVNLPDWATRAIRTGLDEAGFVEGRDYNLIVRSAEGEFDRLPALAADLVMKHSMSFWRQGRRSRQRQRQPKFQSSLPMAAIRSPMALSIV